MGTVDGQGLPLGVRLESATPHEVTLAETARRSFGSAAPRPSAAKPERVIADTAYDSDPLRERRRDAALNRSRRTGGPGATKMGCKLRRYRAGWIVERTNSWLGQFAELCVMRPLSLSISRASGLL